MRLFARRIKLSTASIFCTIFFLTAALQARANEELNSLLKDINGISVHSYLAVNAYYNYSANSGDKSLLQDIVDSLNGVNEATQALEDNGSKDVYQSDVETILDELQTLKELLNTNIKFVKDEGYPDLRLSDDLARQNKDITEKLALVQEKIYIDAPPLKSTPQQKSRDLALLVAQMMTKYSARSSSSVAQTFQGGETDKTLDQLALDVDSVLTSLDKSVSEPEAKKTLNGAQTKWKFIRNSYVNYNDNNVNYVVNLYSIRMIESLRELSEQL